MMDGKSLTRGVGDVERIYSIDYIKFFAIFAVVVIHTFPLDGKTGYFIIDDLARFAVPFFFVASGYFFAQKMIQKNSSFSYFKKYILKLIKIYISWLIFYTVYDILFIYIDGNDINQRLNNYFQDFTFMNLIYYGKGTSGYQLWFLTALIWSIICIFLFLKLKQIYILFFASLILNIFGLFGQGYTMFFELPVRTRDAAFFGLFYTALGFLFASDSRLKKLRKISGLTYLGLAFIFFFLQAMEGYILDKVLKGSHGEYFFTTIFLTAFLFFFALNNKEIGRSFFITKVGRNALGIYIIHVFFLSVFNKVIKYTDLQYLSENILWNIFYTVFLFFISYYTYQFIQKTKPAVVK
jgi:peptidoglycan/LPS O-acetylase OafA/YrhL